MLLKHTHLPNLKQPLICCVSFIFFFFAELSINLACGPEADPYDNYISFFHNNQDKNDEYKPFYFNSYEFLNSYDETVSEATINSKEWAAYLGKQVSFADVETAMYRFDKRTDSILYNDRQLKNADLPDSLASNTFLQALKAEKNKSALTYFLFAKDIEKLTTVGNRWDPELNDTMAIKANADIALKSALSQQDSYLKLRYYYQAQRLFHYGGEQKKAMDVYDNYIGPLKSDSHTKGWALMLKAGEERWLGDSVKAAYLFSRVFELYPERRIQAYQNFNFAIDDADMVLPLAANDNEKSVIYAIKAIHNPHFTIKALNEIYDCNSASPMIGLLLAREINKLEEAYVSNSLVKKNRPIQSPVFSYSAIDSSRASVTKHINVLNKFCERLSAERLYPDYGLGNLASAYLAWIRNDTKKGMQYLAALNGVTLRKKLDDQKHIIDLLLSAQNIKRYNAINEDALLPSLKWLDKRVREEVKNDTSTDQNSYGSYYGERPFSKTARNFYQAILAPAYLKQGDAAKACLAMMMGDMPTIKQPVPIAYSVANDFLYSNMRASALQKMALWKTKTPTGAYMRFLTQGLRNYNHDYFYEVLGTAYLREHNYSRAIAAFKKVDVKILNMGHYFNYTPDEGVLTDPFIIGVDDYPKVYRVNNGRTYNSLDFAIAMNALQNKMRTDPANANNYYKYATALYNTGNHGNSWHLISYSWAASDFGRENQKYYDNDYIKSTNAEKYFLKARLLSKNIEFKAKCTFMAAKCQQKQIELPSYEYGDDYAYKLYKKAQSRYYTANRTNPYFAVLKRDYSKTKYYQLLKGECSYFRDFLNNKTAPEPPAKQEVIVVE